MACFASSVTTGGAHKHAWTKIYQRTINNVNLIVLKGEKHSLHQNVINVKLVVMNII